MQIDTRHLLDTLYEHLPAAVVVADGDNRIRAANPAAVRVFGYAEAELIGQPTGRLYARSAAAADLEARLSGGGAADHRFSMETVFRRKDGSEFDGRMDVGPLPGDGGFRAGFVGVVHDMSPLSPSQAERLHRQNILTEALATLKEGFVVYDADDRLVLFNEAYRAMYRTSAPAIVPGATFEEILRYGVARGQYPEAGESEASREAWIRARLEAHEEPAGTIVQLTDEGRFVQIDERRTPDNFRVGIRTDITMLVRMKTEAERLGTIIETVAQEIYVIDLASWRVLSANRRARENLGYHGSELATLSFAAVNRPADGDELALKVSPVARGEQRVVTYEAVQRRRDGSDYSCTVRVERFDDGDGARLIAFVEDTSELVAIERQLARKAEEYETLVRNLPDAISRSRPDTTLTYVNDVYARFLGKTREELIGQKFSDYIPRSHRARAIEEIGALTPEAPLHTFEQPMIDHAGREHLFLWSNMMNFRDGQPVEILSVGRNITEQRDARERIAAQKRELRARNAALEQFTSIVTHDLKAPLRHVRSFAELIADDLARGDLSELSAYSSHIAGAARRMERMISSLRLFSQVAYRAINPSRFQLEEAFEAARANLASEIADRNATIALHADIDLTGDFELIVQLLQNLIGNAIKYVAPGTAPLVRVDGQTLGDEREVGVCDNGIGIPSAQAEAIFAIFRRLHRDETLYSGQGIGLALCQRIVEAHGGSIRLDTSYGPGSRFAFRLPAMESAAE